MSFEGRRPLHVGDGGDGGLVGADGGQGTATGAVATIVVQPIGVRVRRGPGGGKLHRQSKHYLMYLISIDFPFERNHVSNCANILSEFPFPMWYCTSRFQPPAT